MRRDITELEAIIMGIKLKDKDKQTAYYELIKIAEFIELASNQLKDAHREINYCGDCAIDPELNDIKRISEALKLTSEDIREYSKILFEEVV